MSDARNLRLLVVDDEIEEASRDVVGFYEARGIDVVRPAPSRHGLGSWSDTIEWIRGKHEGAGDPFDLLLIDVLFGHRDGEPAYGAARLVDQPVSPLGLVYGLAVLASRGNGPLPVGWAIRSQDAGRVAADPVAQVAYGLHEALAGSPEELGATVDADANRLGHNERARHVLENGFPSNNVTSMVGPLLRSYRRRLGRAIARHEVTVEAATPPFHRLREWLLAAEGRWDRMADGWIRLRAGRWSSALHLRSIVADIVFPVGDDWDPADAADDLAHELSPILESGFDPRVRELWAVLEACGFDLADAAGKTADPTLHALLFVCAWLHTSRVHCIRCTRPVLTVAAGRPHRLAHG